MAPIILRTSLYLMIFQLIVIYQVLVVESIDPTQGFTPVPLSQSNFQIQRPYDVPQDQRYSFVNGIHKMWVYKTDKPHNPTSNTAPRTEIRIIGYDYTSGVWQFEGYGYVPIGTTGTCIMQVFGSAPPQATTLQLRVYSGSITYYRSPILVSNIYDKWYRINVIHDANANTVKVYIDGTLKYEGAGRTGATHYFKCGVYMQNDASNYMESRWRNIKVFKK